MRTILLWAAACLAAMGGRVYGQSSCSSPANAIVAENCLPGTPQSQWDVDNSDSSIEGFAAQMSVNRGQTVSFKIRTNAKAYSIDIYRLGYYGGMGARLISSISPSAALPQNQPACLSDKSTGLIDCGDWAVSASWQVPTNAMSGIYVARLTRGDTRGANQIFFVVRDDSSRSNILFQASDTTWEAYNKWGGNSLYVGNPMGRAFKVSYNRPFLPRLNLFDHEYPMIRWLEANGYDVSYFSGIDTDIRGGEILNHKIFFSVGHDEYWSKGQFDSVQAARDGGVNLAFFSANEVSWKTRWENSIDGSNTPYRTLVSYKYDPLMEPDFPPTWTGYWRDPKGAPPQGDAYRPENALMGTWYAVDADRDDAMSVAAEYGKMRFWRNTSVASLPAGGQATFPQMLGYEWDEVPDNDTRPAGLIELSASTYSVPQYFQNLNYVPGMVTHHLSLYKSSSGALVFGAGTMQWPWSLDSVHSGGSSMPADPRIQQATVNLLADMGVQPGSLQAGLVSASPSADVTPPVSRVLSPAPGSMVSKGTPVTIMGTASDVGGAVATVEVSEDGGAHWRFAVGRSSWSSVWVPDSSGPANILSRATDDSGNVESTSTVKLNPIPAIVSLNPSSATAKSGAFTLLIQGSNFIGASVVQWNGSARATVFISSGQLSASILASDSVSTGAATVTVSNPAPGGGISNPQSFIVVAPPLGPVLNPMPAISALTPSSATAGGKAFTLSAYGSNFISSSTVQWNGAVRDTVFISSSQLSAAISSADIAVATSAAVTVFNPAPGGGTANPQSFIVSAPPLGPVLNPVPAIASLSPSSAAVKGPAFTLSVYGSNFISSSTVQWNGAVRDTVFISSSQLSAAISSADIAVATSAAVTVFNPALGGGTSNPQSFAVAAPSTAPFPGPISRSTPVISVLIPSSVTVNCPAFTLSLKGANFSQADVVQWNGAALATTFISSGLLTAFVPAGNLSSAGEASVSVFDPSLSGSSAGQPFFITSPSATSIDAPVGLRAYPNPWRADLHAGAPVTFDGLGSDETVHIFTLSGHWVRTVSAPAGKGLWDLTNDNSESVASGYYFYLVMDGSSVRANGTIAVIR